MGIKTLRESVAAVYAKRSASARAKLRKSITPASVFQALSSYTGFGPDHCGMGAALVDNGPYGGKLRLSYAGRMALINYELMGVGLDRLAAFVGIEYVEQVTTLLGFDGRQQEYLWHFEVEQQAEHTTAFRKLNKRIKHSIANCHMLDDGTFIRVYLMHAAPMAEFRLPHEQFVRVCSLAYLDECISRSKQHA